MSEDMISNRFIRQL